MSKSPGAACRRKSCGLFRRGGTHESPGVNCAQFTPGLWL